MKPIPLMFPALLVAWGCVGSNASLPVSSPESRPRMLVDQGSQRAEPPLPANPAASATTERTTTEAGVTYTVRYPRHALLGHPLPITVIIANHARQPAYLTYSVPIRAVSPTVWPNASGKMPYTPLGERQLGNREETSNFRGPIDPGQSWTFTFNVTDYYQLPIPHEYDLHLSTTLELNLPNPRTRLCFDVGGLLIDVKAPR